MHTSFLVYKAPKHIDISLKKIPFERLQNYCFHIKNRKLWRVNDAWQQINQCHLDTVLFSCFSLPVLHLSIGQRWDYRTHLMNYQNVLAPTKTEHDRVKNLEMVSIVTLGSNSGVLIRPKETFCSKKVKCAEHYSRCLGHWKRPGSKNGQKFYINRHTINRPISTWKHAQHF